MLTCYELDLWEGLLKRELHGEVDGGGQSGGF